MHRGTSTVGDGKRELGCEVEGGGGVELADGVESAMPVTGDAFALDRGLQRLSSNSGTPNERPDFNSIASMFWVYTRKSLPRASRVRRS